VWVCAVNEYQRKLAAKKHISRCTAQTDNRRCPKDIVARKDFTNTISYNSNINNTSSISFIFVATDAVKCIEKTVQAPKGRHTFSVALYPFDAHYPE